MIEHIQEWKTCEIGNKSRNLTAQFISTKPPEMLGMEKVSNTKKYH